MLNTNGLRQQQNITLTFVYKALSDKSVYDLITYHRLLCIEAYYVAIMNEVDDEEKVVTSWQKSFKTATDYDLWGQPVEAIDEYHR